MFSQLFQKDIEAKDIFQKYPKNFHQNSHYKSVKQKIMTNQDQQEIVKFPFTLNNKKLSTAFLNSQINDTNKKIQKFKGKKYQIIPMKTISYSTPQPQLKKQQFSKTTRTIQQNQSGNRFASKSIFQNMKKLKDLRKTNYKSKQNSSQKQFKKQEKLSETDDKLDLFKLTSTNFQYKKKNSADIVFLEKNRQNISTQAGKRNTIKYKNSKTLEVLNNKGNNQTEEKQSNLTENLLYLEPVSFRNNQQISDQQLLNKFIETQSLEIPKQFELSTSKETESKLQAIKVQEDKQAQKIFQKYSQNLFADPTLKKYMAKSNNISSRQNQKKKINTQQINSQRNTLDKHLSSPFKASFRIKHIQDNKNILMTTIKKKSKSLSKNQLIQYIQKVVT